jgi:hypothetical protein
METKSVFKSKTVWMNLIIAIAAFFPPVYGWIVGNPEMVAMIVSALNVGLRLISKDKISLG